MPRNCLKRIFTLVWTTTLTVSGGIKMQNWTRLKDLKIPKKGDPMASGDSDSESDSSLSDSPTVVYSTAPTPQLAWDLEARNSKIHTHIIWLLDMIRASFVVPCLENPELLDKESEELRKNTEKNFLSF